MRFPCAFFQISGQRDAVTVREDRLDGAHTGSTGPNLLHRNLNITETGPYQNMIVSQTVRRPHKRIDGFTHDTHSRYNLLPSVRLANRYENSRP